MGTPAAVAGDRITGLCPDHLIPGPLGAPVPSPPLPFSAPVLVGVVQNVLIAGKPAATATCSGVNTPPHVGLHPSDPRMAPPAQIGRVVVGSPTVTAGGKPLARAGSAVTCCTVPGQLMATATTVLVA